MNAIGLPAPPLRAPPARTGSTPCLLVNPRSFGVASGDLAGRAVSLARAHGADIIEAHEPAQIAAGLERAIGNGTRHVFLLAGDGTVQAVADCLAGLPSGSAWPHLLVLGGGRTNLTAADLHGGQALLGTLESALQRATRHPPGDFRLQQRHTLVIEQPPAPPRHGFFVAGALVDRLIRDCHRYRARGGRLRQGQLGTAWCVLRSAVPALAGRRPESVPDLDIELPGCGRLRGPMRLLIATTLAHGSGSFNPYAERGAGALRATAVAARARGFWRSLPRLVSGRFSGSMSIERGYLSGRCESFTVAGLGAYTLDGQSFDADASRPVVIRTGPRIGFLVP